VPLRVVLPDRSNPRYNLRQPGPNDPAEVAAVTPSRSLFALFPVVALAAFAAGQEKKPAGPKVVEEDRDGKTIKVALFGPGDKVTVGNIRYTFLTLDRFPRSPTTPGSPPAGFSVGYSAENVGPKGQSVEFRMTGLGIGKTAVEGEQNVQIRSAAGSQDGRSELWPTHKPAERHEWFRPAPDKEVKSFTIEYDAPTGSDANVWRVVYPRKTWTDKGRQPPGGN
jgi:hypothetical protein